MNELINESSVSRSVSPICLWAYDWQKQNFLSKISALPYTLIIYNSKRDLFSLIVLVPNQASSFCDKLISDILVHSSYLENIQLNIQYPININIKISILKFCWSHTLLEISIFVADLCKKSHLVPLFGSDNLPTWKISQSGAKLNI